MLMLAAVMAVSCSGMRKFDRVEATSVERYSIVYKDNKCGLYDIQADSLVTAIKYNALRYGRTASEGGYEFTIWVGEMENYEGMISIESTTHWSPYFFAACVMSSGLLIAPELTETLSAPHLRTRSKSSRVRIPPPTVRGMKTLEATRRRASVKS